MHVCSLSLSLCLCLRLSLSIEIDKMHENLTVKLMLHQQIGVQWMIEKEKQAPFGGRLDGMLVVTVVLHFV